MKIRKAELKDLSRIAEIFVFNNRINYFPIFHEEAYSFGEMQVVPMIDQYFKKEEILNRIYVYDDGIIRGFTEINGTEIRGGCKTQWHAYFSPMPIDGLRQTFQLQR